MSSPTPSLSDPEWLVRQLPSSLKWGHTPIKISMKDAPPNVKAAMIRLDRTDGKDPPVSVQAVTKAVVNKRTDDAVLIVPKAPSGPVTVGTYKIEWVINYKDAPKAVGSKVYHELESHTAETEARSLEREALKRLAEDDAKAQTAERRKGRY